MEELGFCYVSSPASLSEREMERTKKSEREEMKGRPKFKRRRFFCFLKEKKSDGFTLRNACLGWTGPTNHKAQSKQPYRREKKTNKKRTPLNNTNMEERM